MRTTLTFMLLIPFLSFGQKWKGYEEKNLKDGSGIVTEFGKPLIGYTFNIADTSRYGKITAIVEYQNNRINGRRIQFFNYPSDTASIEYYKNDTLNGPFLYNHTNGKLWTKGIYKMGVLVGQQEYWTESGEKIVDNISYNEKTQL